MAPSRPYLQTSTAPRTASRARRGQKTAKALAKTQITNNTRTSIDSAALSENPSSATGFGTRPYGCSLLEDASKVVHVLEHSTTEGWSPAFGSSIRDSLHPPTRCRIPCAPCRPVFTSIRVWTTDGPADPQTMFDTTLTDKLEVRERKVWAP